MCGIAGLYQWRKGALGNFDLSEIIRSMISTMPHRGPDAQGIWTDPQGRCGLGHLRLSIIDTSDAGRQPMATTDGRWLISFNGEIYNFLELRPQLERAGVRLHGRTDTEVLLESLVLWGADCFPKLDGMFAFAAFDTVTGDLWLARDAFGEKPLYYVEMNGAIAFASELQALEGLPGFDRTVDIDAVAEVLSFQYIGAPRSIYRSVKKLPPAHWMRIGADGQIQTKRYFSFQPGRGGFSDRPLPELVDELEDILVRSIRRRLISDVPLGAFLSGGVDSSLVCALIRRKLDRPVMTFSTGFDGAPESEHLTARIFAQHLGTEHHEEILSPDAAEFLVDIGRLLDEPNADSSCLPTYLLSRFARQHVTVAVSGDGGDEMFGGYGRYFATLEELQRKNAGQLDGWQPGETYYGNRILVSVEEHISELLGFVPEGFRQHLGRLRGDLNEHADQLLGAMRRNDADNYMPGAVLAKVDRMSMRHSLEVRTPYLNTELARFAETLPDSVLVRGWRGKIVLRELAYRHLPRELIDLPKQGFGLPMSDWARTSLLDVASKLTESEDSRLRAAFGTEGISRFMTRQRTPGQFSAYQVWAVAMLESWLRHHQVTIRSLDEEQAKSRTKHTALEAVSVGRNLYLVGKNAVDALENPEVSDFVEHIMSALFLPELVAEHGSQDLAPSTNTEEPLKLPPWETTPTPTEVAALRALRGSTLLFQHPEMSTALDYRALARLSRLGVSRIVFRSSFSDDGVQEIRLKQFSRFEKFFGLMRLFLRRAAIISNSKLFALLGRHRFREPTQGHAVSDLVFNIDPFPETELSTTFMLFEGGRQLPPIRTSHTDIVTKKGGRYSIWDQRIYFSGTEDNRLHTKPFWLVRLDSDTEPLLEFVPKKLKLALSAMNREFAQDLFAAMLSSMDAREREEKFTLAPGDRVVVCTHGLPPGGAERQWVYLAQALAEAGYLVTFVTYESLAGANGHYLPQLKRDGITIIDASGIPLERARRLWPKDRRAALLRSVLSFEPHRLMQLTAAFIEAAPKAVFAQLDHPNVLAGLASHLAGVPRVVLSFRNYNPTHFSYLINERFLPMYQLLSKSNRVLFSGNHTDANVDYANWIGISVERVALIQNAIDHDMFPVPADAEIATVRMELGVHANTPIILGVFRLSEEKDPLTFVETCRHVADKIPSLRAFIVGLGPLQAEIEARIQQLGLAQNVQLLGRRVDVNVLMKAAKLLLLTSTKEGMPNVVMEAQLMGLPIVAAAASGTREVVIPGRTALLCDTGDAAGLGDACVKILEDPQLARQMGEIGRTHIQNSFPKRLLGQRHVDLVCGRGVRARDVREPDSRAAALA